MNNGIVRSMTMALCLLFLAGSAFAAAKLPEGYRDIKLGMSKSQVIDLLQKSPMHFSYDDLGEEIGEIIRGDDLFRYATYHFDKEGILVEIGLQMREIIGRDRCIEMYNTQNGLALSPVQGTVEADRSIEVRENCLVMKKTTDQNTRSAKGPS
ncbi:MAG TPA: hypothetical protein VK463_21250 [Desulfomonilaceae bacterium]|nr:hypothetical protein [Desulfomonilaceae bacterium]